MYCWPEEPRVESVMRTQADSVGPLAVGWRDTCGQRGGLGCGNAEQAAVLAGTGPGGGFLIGG